MELVENCRCHDCRLCHRLCDYVGTPNKTAEFLTAMEMAPELMLLSLAVTQRARPDCRLECLFCDNAQEHRLITPCALREITQSSPPGVPGSV